MPKGVYERSPAFLEDITSRLPHPIGAEHHDWKGEQAGYNAIHNWMRRHHGRASEHLCAECLAPAEHWANLSGEYVRDLEDFAPMCASCHWTFDREVI